MVSHIGRILSTAAIAALAALPVQAQTDSEVWRAYDKKIKPAVFCIRKTALYEVPIYSPLDGSLTSGFTEKISFGSGMSFEETERNGRREYRILTNNHVVSAESNSVGSRLVSVKYALVDNMDDKNPLDDIVAQQDIRNPDQDQAILVTVGAPELPVANISRLGSSSLQQGDRLLTTGFPNAVAKTSVGGTVSAIDYDDAELLPYPGKVVSAIIAVDQGQSGSPVFGLETGENGEINFVLVGLVYAKNPNSDQVRLITPIGEANATLQASVNIPSQRPSLEAMVTGELLKGLSENPAGITSFYNIDDYKAIVKPSEDGSGYVIRHFREVGGVVLQNETLDFRIAMPSTGGITVAGITDTKDGVVKEYAIPAQRQQRLDKYVSALVNHFVIQRDLVKQSSISTPTTQQTRYTDYVRSVVSDQAGRLSLDAWTVYSQLYRDGVISQEFN